MLTRPPDGNKITDHRDIAICTSRKTFPLLHWGKDRVINDAPPDAPPPPLTDAPPAVRITTTLLYSDESVSNAETDCR